MARSKEFEPREALQKAMELFWHKGYSDTSMDDLVAYTGVSRYGLYSTFGDKHELFLAALDHYRDSSATWLLGAMEAPDASLAAVRWFFETLLAGACSPKGELGCLMCNTALALAPHDQESGAKVQLHLQRTGQAFRHALSNAQRRREISAQVDVEAYADYLVGVAQGLFVLARASADCTVIKRFVQVALSQL